MFNFIFFNSLKLILILICIAFFTLSERKVMAAIQRRKGPNVTGFIGLGQPVADGIKLLIKEILYPLKAEKKLFTIAPLIIIILSLTTWIIIPGLYTNKDNTIDIIWLYLQQQIETINSFFLEEGLTQISIISLTNYTLLYVLAISSLNVYGIITAGWASFSKYAFLGALRSSAQLISYEVSIGLIMLPLILLASSFNFTEIIYNQVLFGNNCFFFFPLTIIFFISMLAETNRAPFDLPEAEAELVAGYNIEYSAITFAMFFLGEYSNMLVISALFSILFLGNWKILFFIHNKFSCALFLSFKISFLCLLFILVRALVPRYKYNQLMNIGWKFFLPVTLSIFILILFFLCATIL